MKKLLVFIITSLFVWSCDKDDLSTISNPETILSFTLQKVNAEDQNIYEIKTSEIVTRRSSWIGSEVNADSTWLRKQIEFETELENREPLDIVISIQGFEINRHLLNLDDKDLNHWERNWNYISAEAEISNFWNKADKKMGIVINQSHLLWPSKIELVKTQKVLVNGIEKTYVEFGFSGEAYGVYDGYKEGMGYLITQGFFRGVIE